MPTRTPNDGLSSMLGLPPGVNDDLLKRVISIDPTGALTAIMTGISYATSAEMAKELGPFPGYKKNREHMLRVMKNHRRAAYGAAVGYEGLRTIPVALDETDLKDKDLAVAARRLHTRLRATQSSTPGPPGSLRLTWPPRPTSGRSPRCGWPGRSRSWRRAGCRPPCRQRGRTTPRSR